MRQNFIQMGKNGEFQLPFFNARLQLKNGMCVQKEIVGIKL